MGSASTSNAVTRGGRGNSPPSAAEPTRCSPPSHPHRFDLCHETRRDDLHLSDWEQRQGMTQSGLLSLQIAVVWFSISEPEILKQDLACEPCWKLLEAVKIMNLLFSECFACDSIPCGLACCGSQFLIIFLLLFICFCLVWLSASINCLQQPMQFGAVKTCNLETCSQREALCSPHPPDQSLTLKLSKMPITLK